MKNNYFYVLLFCLLSIGLRAQAPRPIGVVANSAAPICNPGDASSLSCTFTQTYETTGYNVGSIPFNPPFGYTNGAATSLTIDDRWTGIIDLKGLTPQDFNFCFYNNSYIQCLVSTNGTITFSIAGVVPGGLYAPNSFSTWVNSGAVPYSGPSANAPFKNSINGVFQDTNPAVSNAFANPNINYYTTGSYPNRVFVVNIANVAQFGCSSDPVVGAQTSQMILYEGTNIIDVYVARRYPCVSWSSGNGLIGIQNNAGTIGTTPTGRNGGTWNTTNEAWRFTPNGAPIVPTFQWKDNLNNVVGTGQNITVNPLTTTTYTVTATYPTCSPTVNYQVTDNVTVDLVDIPTAVPLNYNVCDTGQTTFQFDFSGNTNHVLNGLDPSMYILTYHTTQASAEGAYNAQITSDISQYQTTTVPVTIWVAVEDLNTACIDVQSFTLNAQNCQVADMRLCDIGNDGSESFNLSLQNTAILDGDNPADYNITYHTTLSSADGTTLNSNLIPAGTAVGQQDNFVSTGQTIYFRKAHVTNAADVFFESFDLVVLPLPVVTGNTVICQGFTTQLASTATPATSNVWVSDNTAIATVNATGLVTGVSAGTANITYTNNEGCQNSVSVTVNATPVIGGTLSACQGATTQLTGSGTPSATTPWSSANTAVATISATGLVTGVASGTSVITYTDNNGCQTTATVTINALPNISGTLSACVGSTSQLTASNPPAAVNPWVSSNTSVVNIGSNGLATAIAPGTATITFTDVNGCQTTASFTVNAVPTVTVNSSAVCAGSPATVTATPGTAGTYNYAWTVPAGATNPGNVASFTTTVAGNYSVVITNTTTNCSSTSATGTVTTNPLPTVTVNSPSACTGLPATITATHGAGSYTYVWTVPAGATNPGNVASFSTTVNGTYSVVITNTVTGCSSASASGNFTTSPAGPNLVLICGTSTAGNTAFDWNNIAGITNFHYVWTMPDGSTGFGDQPSGLQIQIPNPLDMPVTITVTPTGSVCVAPQTITCNCPNPVINNNTNQAYCSGQTVPQYNFATANPYDTVSWTNSNPAIGLPASGTSFFLPSFTAATTTTPMVATITVRLTKYGCQGSARTFTITINPVPTVTVNNPTVCAGATATVTATPGTAGAYTYAWTVPAGASNPGSVASFNATVAGTYSVVITSNATTCSSASASGTVTINPLPTVTVNSSTVCTGAPATVTATPGTAGTYNYVWTVPAGATNPGNVASFTTTVAGNYSVVITNTTTNCSSASTSGTVTNNPLPTVTVNSPSVCAGTSATVTATPGTAATYSYVWTVPAGATNPGSVASFTTTVAGTYSVVITNTTTTCSSASASGTVTVNPLPTVTVNSPSVCAGTPATVTATPGTAGTYTYVWTVPAGVTNPGSVPSFTTTVGGNYSVVITNTATTCSSASASGTVTIIPNPTVTVNSSTVCTGASATVTATPGTAGTYTYVWTVPAGVTNPGSVPSFTTTVAGTYSVVITNTTTTCSSTSASGTVTNNPVPTVTVNNPSVCAGAPATVTATPGAVGTYTYVWTVPAGVTNPGSVPSFTTTVAGTYSVVITNTTTTCSSASASGTVTINSLPTVTVNSPSVCAGTQATVTATPGTAGTYTYVWTVPAGVTNPGSVPSFTTTVGGNYSVVITNTATTCSSASASGTVTVIPNPTVTVNSPRVCTGATATVTATPGAAGTYTYTWTVPTGVTNPGNVPSFTTSITGTYSVVISNGTCSSASVSGTVSNYAVPTIGGTTTICQGSTTQLTGSGGAPAAVTPWMSSDTSVATVSNTGLVSGVAGGNAVITYTTVNGCIATTTVTVNPIITPTFNFATTYCSGVTPSPLATTSLEGVTGTWSPAFNNMVSGTYTFTPTAGQCAVTPPPVTIQIIQPPVFTVTNADPILCDGESVNITMSSATPGTTYTWSASSSNVTSAYPSSGDETTINQPVHLVNPLVSGSITYNITSNGIGGCSGDV
ncbi:beta strand repeat-containing protein, partial [Flavobacterium pedocola]